MLTEILRQGAHQPLSEVLEIEIEEFLGQYRDLRDELGLHRVVRNGYHQKRDVQTGIGTVAAKVPRARDREAGESPIRFSSSILPPYLRRSKSIEDLLPWLYLKGISTGDFGEALSSLLGPSPPGFRPRRSRD